MGKNPSFFEILVKNRLERDNMKKVAIKNKIEKMEEESRTILEKIFVEFIMDINHKEFICKDMLERIVLIYLSLFGKRDYIELEDLTRYELNIISKMIFQGICYIYIDERYLTPVNRYKKMLIISELIEFVHIITDSEKDTIKMLIIREMKKYIEKGFLEELV